MIHRRPFIIGASLLAITSLFVVRSIHPEHDTPAVNSKPAPVVSKVSDLQGADTSEDAVSNCDHPDHAQQCPNAPCNSHAPGPANPRKTELAADFLDRIVRDSHVQFDLPDGRTLISEGARIERDAKGVLRISGRISAPQPGTIFLQRQDFPGVAGSMVGHVLFENSSTAWKVVPEGSGGAPVLKEVSPDAVACLNLPTPEAMPQDHPGSPTVSNPPYQTVIPLQSLPGATGVIYLDFDGEKGPFPGWYDGDAAHSGFDNNTIRDIWIRVAEDYLPFNLNVTTDVKVWQAAPQGQRIRCMVTPTNFYNAGGVAYVGSFNWGGEPTCWASNYTDDGAVTVISHEVGHTLGLYHHGWNGSEYYWGQGSGTTSWAPIMGAGYGKNLKQWSHGDYYLATASWQDDLWVISNQNNGVAYRPDDDGDTLATAAYLNIASGGAVTNQQGIIETTGDVDAFRFKTSGGAVSLAITTATSYSPNLDIYAEIVNASTGVQVSATNAADPALNETISTTLAAGEYLLKITGTGYPSTADNTGYSNYGSLGSYRIDGTVAGGESFRAFSIAENTANGTSVGMVTPTSLTGSLNYTISNGNTGGAFAINATTGQITVASSAALNYETLSNRFDIPATIELFVTISNTTNGLETVRVLVTVTDVNEAPSITAPSDITIVENTIAGTVTGQATATDMDRYDFPVFSIVSGNSAGYFAINSGTGQITVAAPPSVSADTTFNLVIQATDTKGLGTTTPVNVKVLNLPAGFTASPGGLYRTFFNNIAGGTVTDLTSNAAFPNSPDQQIFLTSFDGGGYGDNYGSTIRGYLIPPTTGAYTFYVAADDSSQLILGSGATQVSTPVIAYNDTWTNQYAWGAVATATSTTYNLTAGQPYYIEMRHKEGVGGDHASVAWSGPGISQQVIPGMYLAPYYQNYAPRPTGSLNVSEVASAGTVIGKLPVIEVNTQDTLSNYTIVSGNSSGLFAIDPNTGNVTLAQAGQFNAVTTPYYDITFSVTDNGTPSSTGTGVVRINVIPYTLYFDPNGAAVGSVANGGSYSWVGSNWTPAQGGTAATGNWISGAKANFAASFPGSLLAYDVSIAGYNSGVQGAFSSIEALNGTVRFTGNVDNFYLINPMTVRAATGAAIRFNQTSNAQVLAFNLNNQTATFEGDVAFTTCGMGNAGNVVLTSGTLGLNAPNIYTGSTTINGGVLALSGSGQLYSNLSWGNATVTVNTGGILQADSWQQNGSLGQLGYAQGNLVINGGSLRYTGNTNITTEGRGFTIGTSGATLESAAPAGQVWNINYDSGSTSYGIASNGGALTLTGTGNGLISKVIPGNGALVKYGTGTWTLSASNTYAGGTTVNGGTLVLTNTASLPGAVTIAGDTGNGAGGGTLYMNQPGIVTWSQNVIGGGRWQVGTGSGSQTISLTGTYTSFTGILEVASGSGKINLATSTKYPPSTATLQLNANTTAYVTGGGTFAPQIKLYGGSIGEPTFGQLRIANNSTTTLSGAVTLHGNTSIAVDNQRSATLTGVISESGGSFGFTKNQTGRLDLTGNNTYSGGTMLAAGALRTGTTSGRFGIGNLSVENGLTASIRHTAGNALGRQAYVYLNGTTSSLSIVSGATETVARLYLNGVQQPAGSYSNNTRITGGGTLVVGEIAPNAPIALSANGNSAVSIQLAWTHASVNDTVIKIERSLSAGSGFVEIASLAGSVRSYSDTGLSPNTTYYYRVRAVNAAGNSAYSTVASTITQMPAAPAGLTAIAGAGQVSLSWTASTGAVTYVVRRATTSGGPYSDVASPSTTSYVDSGLLDSTYYYVVAAVAPNGGIGTQSAEVSATPTLADSNGVWNLASGGDWMTSGNWLNSTVAIGVGRTASFPFAAGGTINQNRAGLSLGRLVFSSGNYTISGNALTLNTTTGTPEVSVGPGVTATIATALNGSYGLAKTGSGTLSLIGSNTVTGGVTIASGALVAARSMQDNGIHTLGIGPLTINNGGTLRTTQNWATSSYWDGTSVGGITLNTGGTWSIEAVGMTVRNGLNLNGGSVVGTTANADWGALHLMSDVVAGGNAVSSVGVDTALSGARTFTVGSGSRLNYSGVLHDQISIGSGIIKNGSGTLALSRANTYTGGTTINGGTLAISGSGTLGTGALAVNNGAALDLGTTTHVLSSSLNSSGAGNGAVGSITNGTINLAGFSAYLQSGTFAMNLTGSGSSRLWIGGDANATVELGGNNTSTFSDSNSTIIGHPITGNAGTVKLLSATALGPNGQNTQVHSGTLDLNGQIGITVSSIMLNNGNMANSNTSTTASYVGTVTFNGTTTAQIGGAGNLTLSGQLTNGGFTKTGSGTVTLTQSNNYTGGTNVNQGTLVLAAGAWTFDNVSGGGVTVGSGATLRADNSVANQLNGLTLNGGTVEAINSAGNGDWGNFFLTGNVTATGTSNLNADVALRASNVDFGVASGGTLNVGGVVHNGAFFGIYSGSPATVSKSGAGTMVLTGSHTYTGATSISAGSLLVNGSTAASSSVTVATGATLGGTGTVGGVITIQSGGTLAPGASGVGTLTASSSVAVNGKLAIELNGTNCDRLSVTGNLNITSATLDLTVLSGGVLQQEYTIASFGSRTGSKFASVTGLPTGYSIAYGANSIKLLPTLSSLTISSGTLTPVFNSAINTYATSVPNSVSSVTVVPTVADTTASIKVNGTSVISGATSQSIPLIVGANTISVVVTSQDGTTLNTYTVTVTRAPSAISTLSNLTISSGTLSPVFSSGTNTYAASVANSVSSLTVVPTLTDTTASIKVNGTSVISGATSQSIPLTVGSNTISVMVTAQDGTTTKSYTITVTRAPSIVATLASLTLSTGTLSPVFASATTTYTASVANATSSITVTPTVTDAMATVKVNGTSVTSGSASAPIALAVGSNTITVLATAQDGTTTKTYTITVTRISNVATLASLTLSAGTLSPVFATATTSYTTSVANATNSITVTPTVTDATATVKVNGTSVTSGSASAPIALAVGTNTITVLVTAQDETTDSTYTITVTRAEPSTITSFASWASGKDLSDSTPGGDPDKDGLPNALEYVLGGNPSQADPGIAPVATVSGSNMVFTFNRDDASETTDLTLRVEASTDQVNWNEVYSIGATTASSSPGVTVSENGASADTITVTIPRNSSAAKFARIRATVSP